MMTNSQRLRRREARITKSIMAHWPSYAAIRLNEKCLDGVREAAAKEQYLRGHFLETVRPFAVAGGTVLLSFLAPLVALSPDYRDEVFEHMTGDRRHHPLTAEGREETHRMVQPK